MKFLRFYCFVFLKMLYVFTIGILVKRNRELIYKIAEYFGFYPKKQPHITVIELKEVCTPEQEINIVEQESINGNVSLLELLSIASLVKTFQPEKIFEIGTFDGRTSLNMIINASDDAHLFTLDLPASEIETTKFSLSEHEKVFIKKNKSGKRFENHSLSNRITQLYGDSAIFNFTPYLGKIDMVFIDGSHTYEYIKSDTERAFALLKKKGGLLVWHDLGVWDGVTKYLNEQYDINPAFKNITQIKNTSLAILAID